MQKRSFKFYRKNEAEIMESLGLKPTINSGSTWIEKEDGQNENIICQLKSTDAQSIKINQKDLRMLEKNSIVAHKLPVFAIQFLNTDEVWLMVKPIDLMNVSQCIDGGQYEAPGCIIEDKPIEIKTKKIKSSESSRIDFYEDRNKKFKKVRSAK